MAGVHKFMCRHKTDIQAVAGERRMQASCDTCRTGETRLTRFGGKCAAHLPARPNQPVRGFEDERDGRRLFASELCRECNVSLHVGLCRLILSALSRAIWRGSKQGRGSGSDDSGDLGYQAEPQRRSRGLGFFGQ
jgi:hypothetical protein